jgi:hypothetical protein
MADYYDETSEAEIADLLIGRRIVHAEKGRFDVPPRNEWSSHSGRAEGVLVLDDGTHLYLTGHEGGCSCSAGDYELAKVAAVDNVITAVRVEAKPAGDDYARDSYEEEGTYRIFVFADAQEINVAEFVGSDGNGYYGTGFELCVLRPQASS